ncbi:membrane protein YdbS with pleckstrin-like domain [Paraburkholderia sp. GAS448]|uniref:hypothetical protein n=1 Tax=Paraburkholderia sp. GAS448 TaxID=3035136 RepID=UPI003D1C8DCA
MARTKETRANAAPGAGTIFALRAIGLVILARWLFSMSEMGLSLTTFLAMVSSPWACINLVFIFLVIVLPGAQARAERPFHPLPQWLRQSLRLFALLGFVFAIWSVGAFVWTAGWRRTINAIATTNGWLVAAPALYAAVLRICRPRALWRTNIAARRFAIGRYAVALDLATRTAIVWVESRKVGQYDARELSVRWPAAMQDDAGAAGADPPPPAMDEPGVDSQATRPAVALAARSPRLAGLRRRPKVELLWDSPAAAGHNRQTVFSAPLITEGDRVAARALDSMLRQA